MAVTHRHPPAPAALLDLKSAVLTLTALTVRDADLGGLRAELEAQTADAPGLFDHDPLLLDLGALDDEAAARLDLAALVALLRRHRLQPVACRGGGEALQAQARELGLAEAPPEAAAPMPVARRAEAYLASSRSGGAVKETSFGDFTTLNPVLASNATEQAVIGGLSMGGYLAFALYKRAARYFSGMILAVDIGGATTDVFSVFDGIFNRTVSANAVYARPIGNVQASVNGQLEISDSTALFGAGLDGFALRQDSRTTSGRVPA